jgi:hypothetical protein
LARDPVFWGTVERLAALRAELVAERSAAAATADEIEAGTRTTFETLPSIVEPTPSIDGTDDTNERESDAPPESGIGDGSKDS